jgi:HAE1 family hydrophobic/amphiphilic exporter-1
MAMAITASTLTTICVFVPFFFTEGLAGQLFTQMALTISFSLICSLLVALTLVPMLSSKLITDIKSKPRSIFFQNLNRKVDGVI